MKTAVVTGARSGLGLALTKLLLKDGWSVAVLIRSAMPKDDDLDQAVIDGRLRSYFGDLADRTSRQDAIAQIAAAETKLDVLFNMAGVSTGKFETSPQGLELNYEVNTVAPYAVMDGLLENLTSSGAARVVNTSTAGVDYVKDFDPELLAHPVKKFRKLFGAYSDSKLALSLWSRAVAPELAGKNVTVVSVDPGANKTAMTAGSGMPAPLLFLAKLFFKPASHGANLLLAGATGSYASGDFIAGGKSRKVPFEERAQRVLELVKSNA